jgi:mannose-6-phosphate isomerase
MELYPLSFTPRILPKLWGSERWLVCDRPEFASVVEAGPLKGLDLHGLLLEFGPRLVGEESFRAGLARFPLLLKVIEAQEDLSVQVHPESPTEPGAEAKTECWVFLKAELGASVVAGLKPGMDRETLMKALEQGLVESVLQRFEVREGDAVFVPAGRIHALGRGCTVAEIQQNSDTTYRLWDYRRLENGKPRPLQVAQALTAVRMDPAMMALPDKLPLSYGQDPRAGRCLALSCPFFSLELVKVHSVFQPPRPERSFHLCMVRKGRGELAWQDGSLPVLEGQSLLLPACVNWKVEKKEGELELIWIRPGSALD